MSNQEDLENLYPDLSESEEHVDEKKEEEILQGKEPHKAIKTN